MPGTAMTFNRTFEALKYGIGLRRCATRLPFNRTFEALKSVRRGIPRPFEVTFNRTFEALKYNQEDRGLLEEGPLIAPLRH